MAIAKTAENRKQNMRSWHQARPARDSNSSLALLTNCGSRIAARDWFVEAKYGPTLCIRFRMLLVTIQVSSRTGKPLWLDVRRDARFSGHKLARMPRRIA